MMYRTEVDQKGTYGIPNPDSLCSGDYYCHARCLRLVERLVGAER